MYPAIHLTEDVALPTYLLAISLVYCLALFWVVHRAERFEFSRVLALDVALVIMVAGFIGARLFHVLYEMPDYYLANPLDIFRVWQGGFVFYGGALTAFFSAVFYLKRKGESWKRWADFYAPVGAFGYGLGRIACLL
ncbi:MAG: prolipoprotein diacylglyceryl transferase, partial [Bdellovibrionales bacterium]|nr:prolipoprotein diacylglyceryl transferase [Bdellovibrionales bacterium]